MCVSVSAIYKCVSNAYVYVLADDDEAVVVVNDDDDSGVVREEERGADLNCLVFSAEMSATFKFNVGSLLLLLLFALLLLSLLMLCSFCFCYNVSGE